MIALPIDPRLTRRIDASDVVQETLATANRQLAEYLEHPTVEFTLGTGHRLQGAYRLASQAYSESTSFC